MPADQLLGDFGLDVKTQREDVFVIEISVGDSNSKRLSSLGRDAFRRVIGVIAVPRGFIPVALVGRFWRGAPCRVLERNDFEFLVKKACPSCDFVFLAE